MTAPVTTLVYSTGFNGEPMDFTVSFYIPGEYQEIPVQPTNTEVYIEERDTFQVQVS